MERTPVHQNEKYLQTTAALAELIAQVVNQNPQPFGQENAEDEVSLDYGVRRVLFEDSNATIAVAQYTPEGAKTFATDVPDRFSEALPVSHIEFTKRTEEVGFAGVVYMLDNGSSVAHIDCVVDGNNILSDNSEACANFASSLGFADVWMQHLYSAVEEESHASYEMPCPESTLVHLGGLIEQFKA